MKQKHINMLAKVEPVYKEIEGVFKELETMRFMKVMKLNKRKYLDDGEVLEFGLKSVSTTYKHVDSASLSIDSNSSPPLKAKKVREVKEKIKKAAKRKKRTKVAKPRKKSKIEV
jgi:hypothetical protein